MGFCCKCIKCPGKQFNWIFLVIGPVFFDGGKAASYSCSGGAAAAGSLTVAVVEESPSCLSCTSSWCGDGSWCKQLKKNHNTAGSGLPMSRNDALPPLAAALQPSRLASKQGHCFVGRRRNHLVKVLPKSSTQENYACLCRRARLKDTLHHLRT